VPVTLAEAWALYRPHVEDGGRTKRLVAAYFEYFRTGFDDSLFWAWDTVHGDSRVDPVEKLSLILALIDGAPDDYCVELVGAGELEVLLWRSGGEVIDMIEAEATHNPRLRRALWNVDGLYDHPALEARVGRILAGELRPSSSARPRDWAEVTPRSEGDPPGSEAGRIE
jgi:hypothetical protein